MLEYQVLRIAEEWLEQTGIREAYAKRNTMRSPDAAPDGTVTLYTKHPDDMDPKFTRQVAYEAGADDIMHVILTAWLKQRGIDVSHMEMLLIHIRASQLVG